MNRSKSGMASPWSLVALMAIFNMLTLTNAGPLGPLPMQNVTSADMGLKEESCALGDVVYMSGDEFPGSSPCERCQCVAGGVRCAQQQCEPRPGCKALHRPDHCCPTYQCECEQEGRVYGNGEKLVDPQDPCRVCYCQGGEVVCRRIACFVRDDCTPRLVPGRCCPEYDNCPLRGVTALPGLTTSIPTMSASSPEAALPAVTEEVKQQQITIKEITPVSEIPIITDVKIKEILPSPSIEVAEYSSSKSPLIPREATSEKSTSLEFETPKPEQERPSVVEIHSSHATVSREESKTSIENKGAPSKISLSTQDSINSEIYPSPIMPIVASMGVPSVTPDTRPVASTTRAPMLEEEDPSLFDHNPAFPPLPDDLSVLSNHGDEIVPEPSADTDHMPVEHAPATEIVVASVTTPTELTTTAKNLPDIAAFTTTERSSEAVTFSPTITETASTRDPFAKENPTIKLRSAIATEINSVSPSEEVTDSKDTVTKSELAQTEKNYDYTTQTSTAVPAATTKFFATTEASEKLETTQSETQPEAPIERVRFNTEAESEAEVQSTTTKEITTQKILKSSTTERSLEAITDFSTISEAASTKDPFANENPMIKLRSAISKEIISAPTSQEVTESKESVIETELAQTDFVATQISTAIPHATTNFVITVNDSNDEKLETAQSKTVTTDQPESPIEKVRFLTTESGSETEILSTTEKEIITHQIFESTTVEATAANTPQDQTTSSVAKSNVATEVTSQTELSSLPIETSDQNPHESSGSENVSKDTLDISTDDPKADTSAVTDKSEAISEVIVVVKAGSGAIENVETTEFILTSFGSSESSTDAVEMIKIPGDSDRNAAIIEATDGNKNALTDLIKLVSDVASMSDHTESPLQGHHVLSTAFSDSEEMIPVNAGYKSKNSNFNQNSITEIPFKSKSVAANKQKVVELEDDESGHITDSLPPNDKVEPTTRRPIIDNVSDDKPEIKSDKKDIEIITQSYVPSINRRPTKVIQEENKAELLDEMPQDDAPAFSSSEMVTSRDSSEAVTENSVEFSSGLEEVATGSPSSAEAANDTLSVEQ